LDGCSETAEDKRDLLRKTHQVVEHDGINLLGVMRDIQVRAKFRARGLGNAQELVKFCLPGSLKPLGNICHD
jgi:hypothetical protein